MIKVSFAAAIIVAFAKASNEVPDFVAGFLHEVLGGEVLKAKINTCYEDSSNFGAKNDFHELEYVIIHL